MFKIENIGIGQEVDILVLNKGGNMNKIQNEKRTNALLVSVKEFGDDIGYDLSTANLILLKVFVYTQIVSVILVLILSNNDYTYLTTEGHQLLETILVWFTHLGLALLVWSFCIKVIRKLTGTKPCDKVIKI